MRRILVTGCSSGLGAYLATLFARHGWTVFATVRSAPDGIPLADAATAERLDLHVVELDIRSDDSVRAALDAVEVPRLGLDVLVNNAGVEFMGPVELTTDADLRWQLETNLVGTLRMTRAVLPGMRIRRAGRIVFVSSVLGRAARPFTGAYSASKYAVEGMAEALRWEMLPFGVRVTLVEPGRFPSSLGHNGKRNTAHPAYEPYERAFVAAMARLEPAGYKPDLAEVGAAVLAAAQLPDPPLRLPVGADTRSTLALAADPERYEQALLDTLGLADWLDPPGAPADGHRSDR